MYLSTHDIKRVLDLEETIEATINKMEGNVPFYTKVNEVAMGTNSNAVKMVLVGVPVDMEPTELPMKRIHVVKHKEAPKNLHEMIGVFPIELHVFLKVAAMFVCNKVDATLGHIFCKPYQDKVNQYFRIAMFNLCGDLKLMDKAYKKACDITTITYTLHKKFKKLFVQLCSEAAFTGLCMSGMIRELCVFSLEEKHKELFKFIVHIDEMYYDRCD